MMASADPKVEGKEFTVEKVLNKRLDKEGQAENLNCPERIEEFERSPEAQEKKWEKVIMIMKKEGSEKKIKTGEPVPGPSSASGSVMAGMSTATLRMELHPLLNPVILTNLFDVCPHEDLRNCQLVCQTWHENSLTAWRSTSTLVLKYSKNTDLIELASREDGRKNFLESVDDNNSNTNANGRDGNMASARMSLSQFLDSWEGEWGSRSYRQFHLSHWQFGDQGNMFGKPPPISPSIKGQHERFWIAAGRNLTLLKLSNCVFDGVLSGFRKIIFQACPNLRTLILERCSSHNPMELEEHHRISSKYMEPVCGEQVHLKSLSLYKTHTDEGMLGLYKRGASPLPTSCLELLSHFPSLTTLNVSLDHYGDYGRSAEELLALLNAIKVIRQHDDRKLPLKRFNIGPRGFFLTRDQQVRSNEILSLFQELNLELDYLVVDFSTEMNDLKNLLFSATGKTIRKIKAVKHLSRGMMIPAPVKRIFPSRFPFGLELTNLTTLVMSCTFAKNMELLKWTPNLVKLHLSTHGDDCEQRQYYEAHASKIIANTADSKMVNVKLVKLKELFLGYVVEGDDVRKLGRWMPNLEILSMFLTDQHFTIVCEQWKGLTHLHQLGGTDLSDGGVTGVGWEDDEDDEIQPNITMLKNLRCFQCAQARFCFLTDFSVYNGFLKMPNLRILDISSYEDRISNEAMKALQEKIPNCRVRAREIWREAQRPFSNQQDDDYECKYFEKIIKVKYMIF